MSVKRPDLDPATYAHLRALAQRIHAERVTPGSTLQATGMLHEAWEKLAGNLGVYEDRGHFMAVAARAMRQVAVDHARARGAAKRGGPGRVRTTLSGVGAGSTPVDLLDLDAALDRLAALRPMAAEVVMLRTFAGLTVTEAADALGVGTSTVDRAWKQGRAFLKAELGD